MEEECVSHSHMQITYVTAVLAVCVRRFPVSAATETCYRMSVFSSL